MFSKGSIRWPWKKELVIPEDDDEFCHLLISAIMKSQAKVLAELLAGKPGFDLGTLVSRRARRTLIHLAASAGSAECILVLQKFGADLNAQEYSGSTPMHIAARNGHKECVKVLIENGSDIHKKTNDGLTCLHWVASNGHVELIKYFLEQGAVIDETDNQGQTPLHMCCQNGHRDAVAYLLERNANCTRKDKHGRSALHFVCRYGQVECLRLLLKLALEFDAADNGETPLHYVIAGPYKDCLLLLVSHFPKLTYRLVAMVGSPNVDEGNICKCLEYLCFQNDFVYEILPRLAEQTSSSAQLLLCASADVKSLEPKFLSQMRILSKICLEVIGKKIPNPSVTFSNLSNIKKSVFQSTIEAARTQAQAQVQAQNQTQSDDQSSNLTEQFPEDQGGPSTSVNGISINDEGGQASSSSSSSNTNNTTANNNTNTSNHQETVHMPTIIISDISNQSNGEPNYSQTSTSSGTVNGISNSTSSSSSFSSSSRGTFSFGLTLSRKTFRGKKKLEETEAEVNEEKKKALMNEVIHFFDSSWGAVDEWFILVSLGDSQDLELYADRLPILVHGYYLFCLFEDQSPEHPPKNFLEFVEKHSKVLIMLVSRNPKAIFEQFHFLLEHKTLMDRFMKVVRSQPFEDRREWFYHHLSSSNLVDTPTYEELNNFLLVSRSNAFEDACFTLSNVTSEELKKTLNIRFSGEAGTGAGVRREWFEILSQEIVNPNYALFKPSSDGCTIQPNSESYVNPDHLNFFRFAGRVIALALYYKQLIDVHFTRSFYKQILGIKVHYSDVASIDPHYHTSLQWILDNDLTENNLEMVFAVDQEYFGTFNKVELKPGGSQIPLTEENKHEYVQLVSEMKMTSGILPQINAFLEGFHEIIPRPLIAMFDEYEIELLLCGLPTINIDDWEQNSLYSEYDPTQPIVIWFWEVVRELNRHELVQLLQFVTGCARVPLGGFEALEGAEGKMKFTIAKLSGSIERLPSASTCFNLLKLPEYTSKEMLHEKLLIALHFGGKGFEFT